MQLPAMQQLRRGVTRSPCLRTQQQLARLLQSLQPPLLQLLLLRGRQLHDSMRR
jgi:hypothetical protein